MKTSVSTSDTAAANSAETSPIEKEEFPTVPAANDAEFEAAQERLKTGRNESCPCGSGKKYKKCCLQKDELRVRNETAARKAHEVQQAPIPPLFPKQSTDALEYLEPDSDLVEAEAVLEAPEFPPEIEARLEESWEEFEALSHPTTEQMDEFLEKLLALPQEATMWSELLDSFAHAKHGDLPKVFRRISNTILPNEEVGMGFFYWTAAEVFVGNGLSHLLPEVAAGFRKLDLKSYDAEALTNVEDYLLSEGFEAETLELAEHFLSIEKQDEGLMPYAGPTRCNFIFDLRIGSALRSEPGPGRSPEKLAEELRRDIQEDINAEAAQYAADVICETTPSLTWTRDQFELARGDIYSGRKAWLDRLRLGGAFMRVAKEAWQVENEPPGCTYRGLNLALYSVYIWKEERGKKSKKLSTNLLDYLRPAGMEQRLAQSCANLAGINKPRARLLLQANEILARFAVRHELISTGEAAESEKELSRLREQLSEKRDL